MIRSFALAVAAVLMFGHAASAAFTLHPVAPGTSSISQAVVICGPVSQWRRECQPSKPVYRHHHAHCYWLAGVKHCQ
jgi:hypothetical protein